MAEYLDGNEKAPLQTTATTATSAGKRGGTPTQKNPDWSRFGLSGGQQTASAGGRTAGDDDAREVNEIYAEHEVCVLLYINVVNSSSSSSSAAAAARTLLVVLCWV